MDNGRLTIKSFNCRGLENNQKRQAVLKWLKKYHSSIVLLQETHCVAKMEETWKKEWGGDLYFSHGTSAARGVAILIPSNLDVIVKNVVIDLEGRLIILNISTELGNIILANVYLSTKDKPQ